MIIQKRFLLVSALIHLTVFVVMSWQPTPEEEKKEPVYDEEGIMEMKIVRVSPGGSRACQNTYNGIGIMYRVADHIIIDAPENLPAYKAGVRVGDYLFDAGAPRPEKGPMKIKVRRNGQILHFSISQGEVCYEQ